VTLSAKLTSLISAPVGLARAASVPSENESTFLALVAYQLLASAFFEGLSGGGTVLIHGQPGVLASVLGNEAQKRGLQSKYITTAADLEPSWERIHPRAPDRTLRNLITSDTVCLLNLTDDSAVVDRLRAHLPAHCHLQSLEFGFAPTPSGMLPEQQSPAITSLLNECVSQALSRLESLTSSVTAITFDQLSEPSSSSPDAIIDWSTTTTTETSVLVQPAESQVRFSANKTYWLAGLSGGLGLLLCEWMVRRGAKYIVISSRNPNIEVGWLNQMRDAGAFIKVASW
jgi:hybrid polyketide synthase/nonribosomal peptide synthetase ACE1